MLALMTLAMLGITAGALGGAVTNGLDGMVLGGSAGFVLGVLAWITDNMSAERQSRELLPEHLLHDLNAIARLHGDRNQTMMDDR
ncbi:MAG: hypothetical protein R2932_26770 [Caldilineaceae bacterium]